MSYAHQPVLLKEVLENLAINPEGIYIDATFGRGGHAREILQRLGPKGRLFAIDKDPAAIAAAKTDPLFQDERFVLYQGSFVMLKHHIEQQKLAGRVNGILLDLGVSSPQLDDPHRGFSFLQEGPLDMRMDPTTGISAAEWINSAKEQEIAQVLKDYGEERFARRMAAAIVRERNQQPITTTKQLAEIVTQANPRWEKHKHPATRAFQAIRIFINRELEELTTVLQDCLSLLMIGGRLLVISFHSLEDRIVKQFIQQQAQGEDFPRDLPIRNIQLHRTLKRMGKPIKPSAAEIAANPRSRSAILRIAEKIA